MALFPPLVVDGLHGGAWGRLVITDYLIHKNVPFGTSNGASELCDARRSHRETERILSNSIQSFCGQMHWKCYGNYKACCTFPALCACKACKHPSPSPFYYVLFFCKGLYYICIFYTHADTCTLKGANSSFKFKMDFLSL